MKIAVLIFMVSILFACNKPAGEQSSAATPSIDSFEYKVDRFEDIQILRYRVADFENLSLRQKELVYYLSQAALEGRDMLYDQNNKHNLCIRRTLEAVYLHYGDKSSDEFLKLEIYLKRVWMANGIHHHYSEDKMTPAFSIDFFSDAVRSLDSKTLPLQEGETVEQLISKLTPILFDSAVMSVRTNQAAGVDMIKTSANNYYEGVSQQEVEDFYGAMKNPSDSTPVMFGLNSKVLKENGKVIEKTYKVGGMYSEAISRIVSWLEKAADVAENSEQKAIIDDLISYYRTGDLNKFDDFNIKWVQELKSQVDFVNGFTESYGDPLGMKASWESLVNFKNIEATKRTEIISANAQWFEDNSPIDKKFKKEEVRGVSAKVITAAMLGGDCYPATPIGVNLPNSNWIRAHYGSKSVTIENITEAYTQASLGNGFNEEFMWTDVERELAKKYGALTNNLHTDLHECLGHGSGKLMPGVDPDALKAYGSPVEEARADLFGLYYMGDSKMVELGLLPDAEAYKAQYYHYVMNGLMTQLTRIQPGKNIEQAHMRNRQLIANWVYEKGKNENVVAISRRDGKSYVVVNDYEKLRALFGQLLFEIQRIKSTGDMAAARDLVEKYAVKVNQEIHKQVLARYAKLNIAPYNGFVNPVYSLVKDKNGKTIDVSVSYSENFVQQNLRYSKEYSSLPTYN